MHTPYSLDLLQIILWSGGAVMFFGYIVWKIKRTHGHSGGDVIALEDGGGGRGGDCGGGDGGGGCH